MATSTIDTSSKALGSQLCEKNGKNILSWISWRSWWAVPKLMMTFGLVFAPFLLFRPMALECWDWGVVGRDAAAAANSEFAEDSWGIEQNSWALASLTESNFGLDVTAAGVYQSPTALCDDLEMDVSCVQFVSAVNSPFRCIVSIGDKLYSFEEPIKPTVASVMGRLSSTKIIVVALAVAFLTCFGIGTCREGWDEVLVNNFLYLVVVGLATYLTDPGMHFFSGRSPITIVHESFIAFQHVHPVGSTAIALFHVATYWVEIAAWFSGSIRNMLVWRLMFELVTGGVNEYNHHLESDHSVRCMRIAFIASNDEYVIDNFLREHVSAPFFVYLYLLPNFVMHWGSNFITSMGFA